MECKKCGFWIERQLSSNYNIDQLVPYSTSAELACEYHISYEMQKQNKKMPNQILLVTHEIIIIHMKTPIIYS
jgi:hypothetical protein